MLEGIKLGLTDFFTTVEGWRWFGQMIGLIVTMLISSLIIFCVLYTSGEIYDRFTGK